MYVIGRADPSLVFGHGPLSEPAIRREIGDLADVDFVETAACDHAEHASKAN